MVNNANYFIYLKCSFVLFTIFREKVNVGQEIRRIREGKRMTQTQIAEQIGLDTSSYARIEKKGNKLTVEQLEAIAGALGVTVMELLNGEPQTVQDNERVKELEKRVSELEDRVNDKELIVKNAKSLLNEILDHVEFHISSSIYHLAERSHVGTMTVEYDSGKKVSMSLREYENSYEFEEGTHSTLHTLSQSEEQYFFNLFIESDEEEFFEYFFRRNLIEDKDLLKLYDGYIEGIMKSIKKRRTRKSPKA